jgi:MFS transporter, SP family, galactose:H+ symporter
LQYFRGTLARCLLQIDRLGRIFLLQLGLSVMMCGQAILCIAFAVGYGDTISVFVIGCGLILGGFSLGLGPVTWLLQSEIFPTIIRGRTMAISVVTRNLAEFMINLSFLPLVDTIDDAGTFFFFFVMCLLAILFVRNVLVETKQKEPEDILKEFTGNLGRKLSACNKCRTKS